MFSVSANSDGFQRGDQVIVTNGYPLITAAATALDHQNHGSASNMAIVHCPDDWSVWVECRSAFPVTCVSTDDMYENFISFSGLLLSADI